MKVNVHFLYKSRIICLCEHSLRHWDNSMSSLNVEATNMMLLTDVKVIGVSHHRPHLRGRPKEVLVNRLVAISVTHASCFGCQIPAESHIVLPVTINCFLVVFGAGDYLKFSFEVCAFWHIFYIDPQSRGNSLEHDITALFIFWSQY